MKEKEKDLQKAIKDYLELKGFIVVKFNSTGIYNKARDQYIPLPRRGVSDLIACTKDGRFVAIEVKVGKNKATQEQLDFLEDIRAHNGIAMLAYSIEDIEKGLKNANERVF